MPKITQALLHQRGPAGAKPHIEFAIDGLHPDHPVGHQWWVPVAALRDRREREGIDPCGEANCTGVDCFCLECACCTMALRILMNEVWATYHGQDGLPHADISGKRLAQIGAIPGKTWCEEHQVIEPADLHATGPVAMTLPTL